MTGDLHELPCSSPNTNFPEIGQSFYQQNYKLYVGIPELCISYKGGNRSGLGGFVPAFGCFDLPSTRKKT